MEHFLTHSMKPALPWYQSQRRYKKRKLEFNSPYRNGKILNKIQANQTQPNKRIIYHDQGFLGSSVAKESACNAEDPASIPGSGRFPGEGIGYPLQYSWASLVAQVIKNLPARWKMRVWSLGWGRSHGGEHGNPLQYSCLDNPQGQRWACVGYSPWDRRVRHD